ncbi:single-stranded DNA-binding protein [Raoultella ornithinolytica]|nr:single-stranded DNA-binding protein [Raoultella ornithinolytica]
MNFPRSFRFAPLDRKKFPAHPGHLHRAVLVDALAAKVLKRVKFSTRGTSQQVPAKLQNRGSRNSTGDVL